MTAFAQPQAQPVRVSDAERERTVELLRDAWVHGRLGQEELEDRAREAWEAHYVGDLWHAVRELPVPTPAPERYPAAATWSVILSCLAALGFLLTFGLGFFVTLPLAATGWMLGRRVRRAPGTRGRGTAQCGEIVGMLTTFASLVVLSGCAAVIVAAG